MNNCLLPIELCEHIIDSCRVTGLRMNRSLGSYSTWCQTALVCSAWLPRSRLNLLYDVELRRASTVDLLLRTLQDTPRLAHLVVTLSVESGASQRSGYIPFARMPFPFLLKNCVVLDLSRVNWSMYPPRYAATGLRTWSGIVELRLKLQSKGTSVTVQDIFRFIWSLPRLQYLHLHWSQDHGAESTPSLRLWPGRKVTKCASLQFLCFMV